MATNSDYDKAYATISAALASNPSVNLFNSQINCEFFEHHPRKIPNIFQGATSNLAKEVFHA